ncbi:hypothetical protein ACMFLR_10260 [Delftia tsuruhatensis]|uniref:hypothetical protein n=1 Tax=Delftia tsuruhatensis TaxID=180282 RepID=UPI00244729BD|nr:hypothetical protein [Delftia tsuruhatensis]MDH0423631.1 hypothetical protein [Delftia tsuruhatensis]
MTTAPTPSELLPCPFCGGKPHHGKMMDESMWSRRRVPWRRVRCNECDISTDWVCKGASPSEIERWNRRAELEANKNARIHELEMQALDLASENSILKRQEQEELEARKPLPLSYRAGAMTSSVDGGATVSLHFNDMAEAEAWFVAITDQHDAALTSKATGPLPGSTGGSS